MVQQSTTTVRPEDAPLTTVDRVRWGAVIAGLFAAISVLIVLAVAGIAVGFSTFKAGDNAGGLLLGTGIWGAISVLVAFFVGGGTAARTAAVHGRGNGALNGMMVYLVAVPLLLYTLIGGIGSLLNTVTSAAATGAQIAAPALQQGAQAVATTAAGPAGTQAIATAQVAATQLAPTLQAAATAVSNVPAAQVQQAANTVTQTALTTLLSLGLGLLAAALGGLVGARSSDVVVATTTRTVR